MKLQTKVRFADEKLKKAFEKLKEGSGDEIKLYNNLAKAFNDIKENGFCGIQIPKRLIPKKYQVNNLWKYNLPGAWRLLYSIENQEAIVVSIIIKWVKHKEYERDFNY